MARLGVKPTLLIGILCCVAVYLLFQPRDSNRLDPSSGLQPSSRPSTTTSTPTSSTANSGQPGSEPQACDTDLSANCVTASILHLSFPICLYPAKEDAWVSGYFHDKRYWESEIVSKMLQVLQKHTKATFIDIGAHIGSYMLPAAHLGLEVIAVEPNPRSYCLLSTAARLGNVLNRVHLVSNAVSNVSGTTVEFGIGKGSRAHTFMCRLHPNVEDCLRNAGNDDTDIGFKTTTVTLLDLLKMGNNLAPEGEKKRQVIMKIDTQSSELLILDPPILRRFLGVVELIALQMEWEGKRESQDPDVIQRLFDTIDEFKLKIHAISCWPQCSVELERKDWTNWGHEIVIVNATAISA